MALRGSRPPALGTARAHPFDGTDVARRHRIGDAVSQAKGDGDAQETVQAAWLARLESAERAQPDPGVPGERLLSHVSGQAQTRQPGADLGSQSLRS